MRGEDGPRRFGWEEVRQRVFEEPVVEDDSPHRQSEPLAGWLLRSTDPIARRSRDVLRTWTAHLHAGSPDTGDILARLSRGDDGQFRGAFLELYLHETFRRAGWAVERHPTLSGTTRQPDFLVQAPNEPCVVEATTTNPAPSRRGVEQRYNALIDGINQLPFGDFFLDVTVNRIGPGDLPSGQLRAELKTWLQNLDPDLVEPPRFPEHFVERRGWSVEFTALPASKEGRRVPGRIVGMSMNTSGDDPIVDDDPLRAALARKASRYGLLGSPYVVAVDEVPWSPTSTEEHRKDALFGSSGMIIAGPLAGQWARAADGLWRQGRTWRNTRLSAVLLLSHLRPWAATTATPELWLNPRATHPVVPVLPHWAVYRVVEEDGQGRLIIDPPSMAAAQFWTRRRPTRTG